MLSKDYKCVSQRQFENESEDGFDFLGQNLRKHGDKLITTPSKNSVKGIIAKTKRIMKSHLGHKTSDMLAELNPVIVGWANYHRHVCSKKTFVYVDNCIFKNLWNWAKKRHSNKGAYWIKDRYFRATDSSNWGFFATRRLNKDVTEVIDLKCMRTIKIQRHIKIRGNANPYDTNWQDYFVKRAYKKSYPAIRPEPA